MKFVDILKVINDMGLSWTIFRAIYETKRKTGILKKKFPAVELSDLEFFDKINDENLKSKEKLSKYIKKNRNRFLFNSQDLNMFGKYMDVNLELKDKNKIIKISNNAINGKIYCFNHWTADYGNPINWHRNPINKYEWARDKHWIDIEELSKISGDVKYVWEASRFTQIFYFVRAYALTKDNKYIQAYWEQIEYWIKENPYELGINWKCGQEISFRIFSWIFGLYAFLDSPYTTDKRIFMLMKNIYMSVIRVEKNINFAIKAVQNNHAISEAACLFTVGVLFPFFKDSERLLYKGKKFLEQEGLKQIYEDGSYIQHSNNYHRLMLQDYTWCYRLAELNKIQFSVELTNRLKLAIDFLYQMQDENTGMAPNYGSNDGTLVFPLSSCDYLNYKPQLNTINYIINGYKLYNNGKHNEDLLWFCGIDAVNSNHILNAIRESKSFKIGGYYIIRMKNSFGMIRCTKFKNRPGQADMLHFDLWYKGVNVLTDIGSYSYNPKKKFKDYFYKTKNHNTITINNHSQIKKGPRFLDLNWPEGYLKEFKIKNNMASFSGYHTAYKNIHSRRIKYSKECCTIIDEIVNKDEKKINIKLNWNIGTRIRKIDDNKYKLLIDNNNCLILEIFSITKGNTNIFRGDYDRPAGWMSLYYGEIVPINQLIYEINSVEKIEKIISKIYIN